MANQNEPEGENRGGVGRVIALVFVLALAAFSVWLVNHIIADVKLQNCVFSGRRDCAQIAPESAPGH